MKSFKQNIVELLQKEKELSRLEIRKILKIDNLEDKHLQNIFERDVKALLKNDIIEINKSHNLYLKEKDSFVSQIHINHQGNGFVSNKEESFFVTKDNYINAMPEDIVLCVKTKDKKDNLMAEAQVLIVLERKIERLVGTFMEYDDGFGFVIPDEEKLNVDFYINKKATNGAKSYDKVLIEITKYPSLTHFGEIINPEAEVREILGVVGDKGVDSLSVIKEKGIREEFPAEVKREASEYDTTLSEEVLNGRVDLTDEVIFTIDGDDAKDLDDAIQISRTENGYKLGVHIADVSHFVQENSEIDKEAYLRGTSIYLVDKVIPMLPRILSNNLCSLNEKETKLTISCVMNIDKNGKVTDSHMLKSFIKSRERLTYSEVYKFLNNEDNNIKDEDVKNSLLIAKELCDILKNNRYDRGSIEFDFAETKVELDENGEAINIKPYIHTIANDIIEEFMLLANEEVAKKFLNIPFVYRIHDEPREEKFEKFRKVAEFYGLETFDTISPKKISEFIINNKDDKSIEVLKNLLLQSMQQARYSRNPSPHFGLALENYCHFTSPIRRYPDLWVHRMIKLNMKNLFESESFKENYSIASVKVAEHCSKTERIAQDAERELLKIKVTEYMSRNAGKEFEGTIKNFNKYGVYIYLDNTVEGFAKPKFFQFDEEKFSAKINDKEAFIGQRVVCTPISIGKDKEVILEILNV